MRFAPISSVTGKAVNFYLADTLQVHQLGFRLLAVDSDYSTNVGIGNGGGAEVMYVRGLAAVGAGRLVHIDKDFNIIDVPVTGNTGRPVFVTLSSFNPAAQGNFGWIGRAGTFPVQFTAPATVGPVFAGAAGQATPVAAAGRQLLNATTVLGSAAAFTRPVRTRAGIAFVNVNDATGIFPGMAISGAGIPGGATVLSIEPENTTLRISANATASALATLTFTHTGFGIVSLESAFVQGQIT